MSSTATPQADEAHVRPFAEFLVAQAGGTSHTELSEALHELIRAVQTTGKAGQITYTVKVKPLAKNDDRMVVVVDEVKPKIPSGDRRESVFYIDGGGNLTRNDPRQPQLPLREVARADAGDEPREVAR